MPPVHVFASPAFADHDTGGAHPEKVWRADEVVAALERLVPAETLVWHEATTLAPRQWIERIHTPSYVNYVEESCLCGRSVADNGDTHIGDESFTIARLAAGAALSAVDIVMAGEAQRAFVAARPPGHHARPAAAMGFCLFNSVAIAAAYAREQYGLERVAILDFDVHHGNGTQEAFWTDPNVFFHSIHQLPLYPHTGEAFETGADAGQGLTLNCPVPAGATMTHYQRAWREDLEPVLRHFRPQLILVSAGFDADERDPLAEVNLTSQDFGALTHQIVAWANEFADGRIVSLLEGGYDRQALGEGAAAHVAALAAH